MLKCFVLVQVQINEGVHTCAGRNKVPGAMASQAWVAERALPYLRRMPNMGPTALKEELDEKYGIDINSRLLYMEERELLTSFLVS